MIKSLCSALLLITATTLSASEQMMPANEYSLHVTRHGQGDTLVIFEAGFGTPGQVWQGVIGQLDESFTSISYSRAGIGKSGGAGKPKTITEHLRDLHVVIAHHAENKPVMLVGHSYGGLLVTEYTRQHPEMVKAIVLVDPATMTQRQAFKQVAAQQIAADDKKLLSMLPPAMAADYRILMSQLDSAQPTTQTLPDVPLILLTSTRIESEPLVFEETRAGKTLWKAQHAQLFAQFHRGQHLLFADAGHSIHREQPVAVINAIETAAKLARGQLTD